MSNHVDCLPTCVIPLTSERGGTQRLEAMARGQGFWRVTFTVQAMIALPNKDDPTRHSSVPTIDIIVGVEAIKSMSNDLTSCRSSNPSLQLRLNAYADRMKSSQKTRLTSTNFQSPFTTSNSSPASPTKSTNPPSSPPPPASCLPSRPPPPSPSPPPHYSTQRSGSAPSTAYPT